ncbi:translation termination inhibitor protein itt1 [Rhizophlyctis rosea]|nr:translation termination inhibitor protein itt1 [Rhizophlyctis rosea]
MKIAQKWLDSDEKGRAELEMRYGKKTVRRLVEEFERERETLEWKRNNTTGCPTCEISVLKSDGCNHMTCSCGTHFCYLCGAYLDKRRPYMHFNQLGSPCYGRLFEGALPGGRNPGDIDFDDQEVMNEEALMDWALREEEED